MCKFSFILLCGGSRTAHSLRHVDSRVEGVPSLCRVDSRMESVLCVRLTAE